MNLKDEIKKLTNRERIFVAILSGWTILHLILLFTSHGSTNFFWPFDTEPRIDTDYDFSEFAIYGLIPWIVFIIYKFLNNSTKEQ